MPESNISYKNILVCLSASPSCRKLIETAAKYINPGDRFIALYVGLKSEVKPNTIIQENIDLVKQYKGEIQILESNDVVSSIVEYARYEGVSDIFIGYCAPSNSIFSKRPIGEALSHYLSGVDIHIIPSTIASNYPSKIKTKNFAFNIKDILIVFGIMAIATLLSIWFDQSRFSNGNIITIYILAVLLASILTSHQTYGIIAAALYILLFNFKSSFAESGCNNII